MAAVITMIALMSIFSAAAVQEWSEIQRRDNEAEMIFRAEDLTRAIMRYRQDKGATIPLTELDLLLEPGNKGQYFVRQLWTDPLVKDGKWGLLYEGPGGQIVDPNSQNATASGSFQLGQPTDTRSRGGQRLGPNGVQEISGLPIIGVKSLCKEDPFRERNGVSDYAEWKFTLFDLMPGMRGGQQGQSGQQGGGVPGGGSGAQNQLPGAGQGRPPG
jgi:type II secretory pathway pseudopilin PulG